MILESIEVKWVRKVRKVRSSFTFLTSLLFLPYNGHMSNISEHEKWKPFWDEQAKVTDPHQAVRGDKIMSDEVQAYHDARLLKLLDLKSDDRVLDAGCGVGDQVLLVAPHAGHVTAIDFAPQMVERCRQRVGGQFSNVAIEVADVTGLPYQDGSFDKAVSIAVLQYLNPDEVEKMFSEVKRVVKPGGIAVFHIKDMVSPTGSMITFGRFLRAMLKGRPPLEYEYRTHWWYTKRLRKVGSVEARYAYGTWTPFMPKRLMSGIATLETKFRFFLDPIPHGKEYFIKVKFPG